MRIHHQFLNEQKGINYWAAALILCFIFLNLLFKPIYLVDDALITFRYAHNLANHGELVFNLGENVEGITNFLWAILLAIPARFDLDIGYSAIILSLGLLFWMGDRSWRLGKIISSSGAWGILVWGIFCLSDGFYTTMTNGLEAPLYAALIFEVVYQYSRGRIFRAFLFAGGSFLTRPEGLGIILLLAVVTIMTEENWREVLKGLASALFLVFLLEIFRFLYYQSLVPNSVIAKSFPIERYLDRWTFDSIYYYFAGFVKNNLQHGFAIVGILIYWVLQVARGKTNQPMLTFSLGGIALAGGAVVKNGGDWMLGYRLIFQYAPLMIVCWLYLIRYKLINPLLIIGLMILLLLPYYPASPLQNIKRLSPAKPAVKTMYHWPFVVKSSLKLKPVLEPSDIVAAEGLGYVSFQLIDNPIHDLLGLTDRYLAVNGKPIIQYGKGDPGYSLGVIQPAVVIVHKKSFILQADQSMLDKYQAYCYQECSKPGSDMVMIRNDKDENLGAAFQSWQKISLISTTSSP